ncbi:chorismate mutase [Yoonia maritima]|uniref:chorismate mutase n=1 Tax=Yoonia maritima TaxID=1435347 RepID=UPI000D0EB655|nr:chorismate mutase [Yoonia maritima]
MTRTPPASCHSMAELRRQIDALDSDLVALLIERAGYIDRAVALKKDVDLPARIDSRVDEVIENVRGTASAGGLDPELAETIWSQLIEWSIAREAQHIRE